MKAVWRFSEALSLLHRRLGECVVVVGKVRGPLGCSTISPAQRLEDVGAHA
jgi:hypothetical protein